MCLLFKISTSSRSCWNIFPPSLGSECHQSMGSDTYSRQWSCSMPDIQYRVSKSHPSSVPTRSGSHRAMNVVRCDLYTTTPESSSWFHRSPEWSADRLVHWVEAHLGSDQWSAWPDYAEAPLRGRWICLRTPPRLCPSVCRAKGPFLEVMATVFFFSWGLIIIKTNFPVLEMSLLHCFAVTKEMVVGGATSSSMYNLFSKVTITTRGLESYTTCHFHKYGWPNNTSQTSKGATSHNTSSVKGLMLYGMQHSYLTRRSCPWWSHPMVYNCGCSMVSKPSRFMTSAGIRFFWLSLLTMNYSGEPFTHTWEWKRHSSSSGSSGSSFWIFVVATMVLVSTSIIWFPLLFPLSGSDSESEHASDFEAFSLATSDCLARHSLVFWVELLWNSRHFPVSFFGFTMLFFALYQL